jgi:hypothetical protein
MSFPAALVCEPGNANDLPPGESIERQILIFPYPSSASSRRAKFLLPSSNSEAATPHLTIRVKVFDGPIVCRKLKTAEVRVLDSDCSESLSS